MAHILVMKFENVRPQSYVLNEKCNLLGWKLFYLLCGEREQVLGLISSCAKCSFKRNNKNIMAHSYFQQGLVWKADRSSN